MGFKCHRKELLVQQSLPFQQAASIGFRFPVFLPSMFIDFSWMSFGVTLNIKPICLLQLSRQNDLYIGNTFVASHTRVRTACQQKHYCYKCPELTSQSYSDGRGTSRHTSLSVFQNMFPLVPLDQTCQHHNQMNMFHGRLVLNKAVVFVD